MKPGEIKTFSNGLVLVRDKDCIWRDKDGAGDSLEEDELSADSEERLGVYPFVLPADDALTPASRAHDHAFSSQYFRKKHTREEAEDRLEEQLYLLAGKSPWERAKGWLLSRISRAVSWRWW